MLYEFLIRFTSHINHLLFSNKIPVLINFPPLNVTSNVKHVQSHDILYVKS